MALFFHREANFTQLYGLNCLAGLAQTRIDMFLNKRIVPVEQKP